MARKRKDETSSGLWRSEKFGEHGFTCRAREKRRGGAIVLDSKASRAEPTRIRVRDADGRLLPDRVRAAEQLAKDRAAQLRLDRLRQEAAPTHLTVAMGFALFHDPEKGGLPKSKPARVHHNASRTFWEDKLERDTPWNRIEPSTVSAAALNLGATGAVQSADKRVKNLRTVFRWLSGPKALTGLLDPTRGFDFKKLWEGYRPRRPSFTLEESAKLIAVRHEVDPRFALMLVLIDDSGARSAAIRRAMRSMLDEALELTPTIGQAPFGWLNLPAMKGQERALTFLTLRQRIEIARAIGKRWNGVRWVPGFLSELERRYQETGADYPLLPGGNLPRSGVFTEALMVSANSPLNWLHEAEEKAGVKSVPNRGFHGIRRGWSLYTYESTDLDTLTDAGAWSDRDTPNEIYVAKMRAGRLAKSREAQERKHDSE